MKHIGLAAAWIVTGSLALSALAHAHGGTYRGPGDTVPAGGGGGSGGVPTPGSPLPGAPTPGGPVTPGVGTPGMPGTGPGGVGPAQTGGGDFGTDVSVWQFWWGFNKDPYLNLRAKVHAGNVATGSDEFWIGQGQQTGAKETLAPSELEIRGQIVPALRRVLREERNNNILSGALVALARIGDDPKAESGRSELATEFVRFLGDPTQEVAETAALCLGILGSDSPDTLALLAAVAENDVAKANAAIERIDENAPRLSGAFNFRTRSFATYALGLIGSRSALPERRQEIVRQLVAVADGPARVLGNYDLSVACIIALGLVPLEDVVVPVVFAPAPGKPFPRPARLTQRAEQVAWLMSYYEDERNTFLVRAHVPRAVARLCASATEREDTRALKASVARRFLADIGKLARTENELKQSCILALGALGDCDDDELDREIRASLIAVRKELADLSCRNFAAIAVAQVAGRPGSGAHPLAGLEGTRESENVRMFLLDGLARGKGGYRAWAGLSLGVLERALSDAHQPTSNDARIRLREALADAASPAEIGAFAIASGIQLDVDATGVLRAKFASTADEEARGYVAIALGLVNDRESIPTITEVVEKSRFRPELLRSAAIGLGLMGDKAIVPGLVKLLGDARGLASQAAISSGLGFIGDRRAIEPLVKFLENREHTDTSRGFAAAALGMVADRSMLPWNATISVDLNYRASVPTLTSPGAGTGVLDIL